MATLTIQPDSGTGNSGDTALDENVPDTNTGSATIGTIHHPTNQQINGIFKFDFSALSAGVTITSATLTIRQTAESGGSGKTVTVNRLTQTGFVEAQATWNDYATSTAWASAGGDFTTDDSATAVTPSGAGDIDFDVTNQVIYAKDNTSEIAYFILLPSPGLSGVNNIDIGFRDNGTAGNRPKLVIEYHHVLPSVLSISANVLTPADVTDNTMLPSALAIATTLIAPGIVADGDVQIGSVQAITATLSAPSVIIDVTPTPSTFAITAALLAPVVAIHNPLSLEATLPAHTLEANLPAVITLEQNLPALTLEASCKSGQLLTLEATLPALTLVSHMGMHMVANLPALTLDSTLTVGGVMSLNRILPALTLEASMTSGRVMTLTADLPALTLSSNILNGNVLTLAKTLLALTLEADATNGNTMSLTKNLPALTLVSSVNSSQTLTLTATLPALELEAFADNYLDRYI